MLGASSSRRSPARAPASDCAAPLGIDANQLESVTGESAQVLARRIAGRAVTDLAGATVPALLAEQLATDTELVLTSILTKDRSIYENLMRDRGASLSATAAAYAGRQLHYPEYASDRDTLASSSPEEQYRFFWAHPDRRFLEIVRIGAEQARFGTRFELGAEWNSGQAGVFCLWKAPGIIPPQLVGEAVSRGKHPLAWVHFPWSSHRGSAP
jgi:hypothetical protein